jgi:hypothetical protein
MSRLGFWEQVQWLPPYAVVAIGALAPISLLPKQIHPEATASENKE